MRILFCNVLLCFFQENPSLQEVIAFGTDGDENLSSALSAAFKNAYHLLCDIHMQDNIRSKMNLLGITGSVAQEYLSDIFGEDVPGNLRKPGLVDCATPAIFKEKLAKLSPIWRKRHSKGTLFEDYFVKHKAENICNCMSAELRSMCGLGYPPKPYVQNANECINAVVKNDILSDTKRRKKLSADELCKSLQRTVTMQENEVLKALYGQGQYRLKPEYAHLKVDEDKFWRMNRNQRQHLFEKSKKASLLPASEEEETKEPLSQLSFPYSALGQTLIPTEILRNIWEQAAVLISNPANITLVPGATEGTDFFVAGNGPAPHRVKINQKTGHACCDKDCHRFNAQRLCQHIVAVAENCRCLKEVLATYTNKKTKPNLLKLSNTNLPKSRGRKASKATERRKGSSNKPPRQPMGYASDTAKSPVLDQHEPTTPLQSRSRATTSIGTPKPTEGAYEVFLLQFCHPNVQKCYGCRGPLKDLTGVVPQPPNDLVIVTKTRRTFYKEGIMQREKDPGNVYFHIDPSCVKQHNSFFLSSLLKISNAIKDELNDTHKAVLNNIGVNF
jgi:hypothetical protein